MRMKIWKGCLIFNIGGNMEEKVPIGGWKTKTGSLSLIVAGLLAGARAAGYDVQVDQAILALSLFGAGIGGLGLGHKWEKLKSVLSKNKE